MAHVKFGVGLFVVLCFTFVLCDLEASTTEETTDVSPPKKAAIAKPVVRYLHYDTEISNRYARTVVSSNVANPANVSQEVNFNLVIPETAFISGFVMIIKEKEYEAYVKEKEEAKQEYDAAVAAGQSAATIVQSVRDSNRFQVSVNVEAEGKVTFKLTYEELLARTLGVYTHTVNVNPGQIVKDLNVKVDISEPVDITNLKVLEFQTKNEIVTGKEEANKLAKVAHDSSNPKIANITWSPTKEDQIKIEKEGLKGQLIIQYDVDRTKSSQILLDEGYFVHFFTPDSSTAKPLAKHAVFVLDISGSMHGRKMDQMKEAMQKILDDLNENDYYSIVLFSGSVIVWSPAKTEHLFPNGSYSYYNYQDEEIKKLLDQRDGNDILLANPDNVKKGKEFIDKIFATDATNIMGGLREGIKLIDEGQTKFIKESNRADTPQPMIIFLTDGEPNVEVHDPNTIVNITKDLNKIKTPIYSLSFGEGADLQFLRRLSLTNFGFARNIYEASDAALQLNNFYKMISSPLMSDVTFNYVPGQVQNGTLTTDHFPVLYHGSEVIVAGKIDDETKENASSSLEFDIVADKSSERLKNYNSSGEFCIIFPLPHPHPVPPIPETNRTIGKLEKVWAYLTIKQLLDKDTSENSDDTSPEKEEALKLALKYSFVTPLTSLVVVKPNDTKSTVEPERTASASDGLGYGMASGFSVPLTVGGFPANAGGGGAPGTFGPAASYGGPMYQSAFAAMPMAPAHKLSTPASYPPPPPPPPQVQEAESDLLIPIRQQIDIVPLESVDWVANRTSDFDIEAPAGNFTVKFNETDLSYSNCLSNGSKGFCRHLQYCALDVFASSFNDYTSTYFCPISGKYAGVCCPFEPPQHLVLSDADII